MTSISELFQSRRQQVLSGFVVYILEDAAADGKTPARCVCLDEEQHVLRCCFLSVAADTREYSLTVIRDVYGPLRASEFDETGTIGGLRCVIDRYDRKFLGVTGVPDPLVFRTDREKSLHFGRLP